MVPTEPRRPRGTACADPTATAPSMESLVPAEPGGRSSRARPLLPHRAGRHRPAAVPVEPHPALEHGPAGYPSGQANRRSGASTGTCYGRRGWDADVGRRHAEGACGSAGTNPRGSFAANARFRQRGGSRQRHGDGTVPGAGKSVVAPPPRRQLTSMRYHHLPVPAEPRNGAAQHLLQRWRHLQVPLKQGWLVRLEPRATHPWRGSHGQRSKPDPVREPGSQGTTSATHHSWPSWCSGCGGHLAGSSGTAPTSALLVCQCQRSVALLCSMLS